jgi:predicted secreted hydrolase
MSLKKVNKYNGISSKKILVILLIVFFLFVLSLSLLRKELPKGNSLMVLAEDNTQYELPSENQKVIFPQAHWPHKEFRHEWWYLTANLNTESGQRFATQWTLFRTTINDQHWYFAHAALADTTVHLAEFRDGREELGNVELINFPFTALIDDWGWRSSAQLLPAQLTYGSAKYGLAGGMADDSDLPLTNWQVNLFLSDANPFYLQGVNGFSKKHPSKDIASYYYSQPFISVKGDILWQGERASVTGTAWFDREWGSKMLSPEQQGWDWFSLRLTKDRALMIYRIRSEENDFLYGSVMDSNGDIKILATKDIRLKSQAMVQGDYPQAFTLEVQPLGINLMIKIINDQQVMRFGIEYFEGMVTFSGSHRGEGFVEMTGYH